jgi:Secretory lipase
MNRRGLAIVAALGVAALLFLPACGSGSAPGGDASPSGSATAASTDNAPCDPAEVPQAIDPSKYGPGDVLGAREIPVTQLTGARAWRVLYVSIGVDEETLLPVCGTVVTPDSAGKISLSSGRAKVLTWAHGTLGLAQKCQPSTDPDSDIFGAQPGGIGAVGYGTAAAGNLHQGQPDDGVLQTAIRRGWTVAATDYYAGGLSTANQNTMPFMIGTMSAAAVLDSARAAGQVLRDHYGSKLKAESYDVVTWGWSQGGGSAFWAGQLGRRYYARTAPRRHSLPVRVVGTAVVAPASTFVAGPTEPQSTWGTHWIDREMHQTATMNAGGKTLTLPVGVSLFGNFIGAWPPWSRMSLTPGARFPAYPPAEGGISQEAILTQQGIEATALMVPECVQQQAIFALPFSDPAKTAYFVQPIWGQPSSSGQYQGQMDQTCNTTTDGRIKQWCKWLRYNEPGPAGTNPYDKVPMAEDGSLLPIFIGQGEDDTAVHCVNSTTSVPPAADCLSRRLYNEVKSVYCPKGAAKGSLQLDLWRATPSTPAEHSDIPGLASDDGHLSFTRSPLAAFMALAFAGTGPPNGCKAAVINP